jgi:serine/threonine protein kinase
MSFTTPFSLLMFLIWTEGRGSFGTAFLASYIGGSVVVKRVRDLSAIDRSAFVNEALMLSRLSQNPNVVPFVGAVVTPKLCLVLRYAPNGTVEVCKWLHQSHRPALTHAFAMCK